MKNISLSLKILEWLHTQGVQHVSLCPGGRNSPFVEVLSQLKNFVVHTSFDERSAGFHAMALSQRHGAPTAILTTSGTAVAEILPSVIEAFYTQTPLIVISADRPRRMRGSGAPQAIEQVGIFGDYVELCLDCEKEFIAPTWTGRQPLHINVCFDEPLIDEAVLPWETLPPPALPVPFWGRRENGKIRPSSFAELHGAYGNFLKDKKNPLLLIGTLTPVERTAVSAFAEQWGGAIYAESTSGLREEFSGRQLVAGDRILLKAVQHGWVDAAVRVGGVPTARLWRNLENGDLPVFSISSRPFAGLSQGDFFHCDLKALSDLVTPALTPRPELLLEDQERAGRIEKLLEKYPKSEPSLVAWLSTQIPVENPLYIGNSLPIRHWEAFADRARSRAVLANRGANGIDGQLSSALAYLSERELWVILGDLTALYDANALWFWRTHKQPLKLVVINNGGGQIFSRMFESELFLNSHALSFEHFAATWQLPHCLVNERHPLTSGSALIEVRPDESQTAEFWRAFDELWKT